MTAGMAAAAPVQRDASVTFASWHARVQEVMAQGVANQVAEGESVTIGRLWEQLASDLFLNNFEKPIWGWADAKSLGLLEYWLTFDPSTHFVLLATSPEQVLADHLARLSRDPGNSYSALQVDRLMAEWEEAHRSMLRFALCNPARCIFVQADELPLAALVDTAQAAWPRHLGALRSDLVGVSENYGAANGVATHHLLRYFATEICAGYPHLQALKYEVESVAMDLSKAASSDKNGPLLASVLATVALAEQVPTLTRKVTELQSDLELEKSRSARELSQQKAQAEVDLLASLEVLDQERAAYALAAKAQSSALAQVEDDLVKEREVSALLNSRRDQDELQKFAALASAESFRTQLSDAQSQAENLSAELSQTREQLNHAVQDSAQLQSQLAFAENALSELQAKSQADQLILIQELDKVRLTFLSDADALKSVVAELNVKISHEQNEKADALAQCERETKAKFALSVQCDAFAISLSELEDKSNRLETLLLSVEAENTLLLAQLSQVQHELERYYLRNKEIGSDAGHWALRFRRVMSRQADGIDWESARAEFIKDTDGWKLRCYANQVAVTGKVWDSIEFAASIHAGAMVYHFDRRPGGAGLFTRWPLSAAKSTQFTVIDGLNSANEDGSGVLREISTSDWDLLRGLPRLIGHALVQQQGPWPKGMPKLQAWQDAGNATGHALSRQPMALRFDATRLQSSKVLADREYLMLRVEQLSLANKRFASFEFRFGCSLGKIGEFGQNARLEFVKGNTETAFETWAPNFRDLEGERLDLVFVFPTSMNLKDWTALSINDRGLVLLLADQLPTMLGALDLDKVSVVRPLAQWVALAEKLRTFVRTRLDVTGVQQVMPDMVSRNLQLLSEKSAKTQPDNRIIKARSQQATANALSRKSARLALGESKL